MAEEGSSGCPMQVRLSNLGAVQVPLGDMAHLGRGLS